MLKGIGTDLVSIQRIKDALAKHGSLFAKKILGIEEYAKFEQTNRQINFLAKRFAAKEAVAKALGTGFSEGVSWKDIQVCNNKLGKPEIILSGRALEKFTMLGAKQVMISLSDEVDLVIAYVIIE